MAQELPTLPEEPKRELEFLISLKNSTERRVTQIHMDLIAISEQGALLDYDLNMLEQIKYCKIGVYCLMNELRHYDRLVKDIKAAQDNYLEGTI